MAITSVVARLAIGGLLLLAGLSKAANFQGFVLILPSYRLTPRWLAPASALGIVLAEVFTGVALCAHLWPRLCVDTAIFLFLVFAVAVAGRVSTGPTPADCGCLGRIAAKGSKWRLVARNVGLAGAAALASPTPSLFWAGAATVALALVTLGMAAYPRLRHAEPIQPSKPPPAQ